MSSNTTRIDSLTIAETSPLLNINQPNRVKDQKEKKFTLKTPKGTKDYSPHGILITSKIDLHLL